MTAQTGQSDAPPKPIAITVRKKKQWYVYSELECFIGGRGFAMKKLSDGEVYHIRLDDHGHDDCTCKGFCKWSYCKHIRALKAAISDEQLA